MPVYTAAALVAVAVALLADLLVCRTRLLTMHGWWASYAIVLFFQFVVNGVLTGRGVVRYDAGSILGLRLFFAPVEDVAFGFALVLLTVSLWWRLGGPADPAPPVERPRPDVADGTPPPDG